MNVRRLCTLCLFLFVTLPSFAAAQSSATSDPAFQKGMQLYQQGRYGSAARIFNSIAESQQGNIAEAYFWLGLSLFQNRQGKDSVAAFANALDARGGHYPESEAQLGALLLIRGEIGDAIRHLHQAISDSNGVEANAHYNLGMALWRQEDYGDAQAELYTAITQRTPYPDALYALGMMMYEQKRYDDSERYLQEYVRAQPQDARSGSIQNLLQRWDQILAIPEGGAFDLEKPNITKAPEPKSTRDAKGLGVTGKAILEAIFTAGGHVENPIVIRGLGFGLDEKAMQAMLKIKFKPAQQNLTPVTVRMRVEMIFQ